MTVTRKEFHNFVAPFVKAAHRYANNHCVGYKPNPVPAGVVVTHAAPHSCDGETIHWNGFTVEISMCRRPRVVCRVPTPFSLFTFNYCLKFEGKQLAHGSTLPEFLTFAMRAIKAKG